MKAIDARGLTKSFGKHLVVDHVDLGVDEGQLVGFLGPNGAGKTTTIRLLLGLMHPDLGSVRILGHSIATALREGLVGALVEQPVFYPWLTGRQNLRVLLRSGSPAPLEYLDTALDRAGLAVSASRKVGEYSQGMKQRLGLASAIMRSPRVLILDEPANGLDPAGIYQMRELLRDLSKRGTAVFLSSHQLSEVELLCDKVAVISNGRLTSGDDLEAGLDSHWIRVVVRLEDEAPAIRLLRFFEPVRETPGTLLCNAVSGRAVSEALARGGIFPESVQQRRASLEERFLQIFDGAPGGSP